MNKELNHTTTLYNTVTAPADAEPHIIAGPCSAETEEQVMKIAAALAGTGKVHTFRAGIWKPRTRPGSFEGIGTSGLSWLRQVQQQYALPCATEVATSKHVYEALKYSIDTLWIGARTTANPFAMQEIADALQGIDVKLMIKNPVNPDVELWTGAVERVLNAGITRVSAIHRGFSTHEKGGYRNAPYWQIPLELKRRFPALPMISDPSHMGGSKNYLYEISSKALQLGFNGLMIETHNNPRSAWSDAAQQITPGDLLLLLKELAATEHLDNISPLAPLRQRIDMIDDNLLEILQQRMSIAEKIGMIKKEQDQPALQSDRWQQVLERITGLGVKKGLSETLIHQIFTAIHAASVNKQQQIIG